MIKNPSRTVWKKEKKLKVKENAVAVFNML